MLILSQNSTIRAAAVNGGLQHALRLAKAAAHERGKTVKSVLPKMGVNTVRLIISTNLFAVGVSSLWVLILLLAGCTHLCGV